MSIRLRKLFFEFIPFFSIGLVAFLLTFKFDEDIPLYRYGANTWPAIIAISLMVCVSILFIYTYFFQKKITVEDSQDTKLSIYKVWGIFTVPVFYVVLIPYIGFYISTIIFVPLYTSIMGKFNILKVIFISVPAVCLLIIIFTKFLFVPFPNGTINIFYQLNSEIVNILY